MLVDVLQRKRAAISKSYGDHEMDYMLADLRFLHGRETEIKYKYKYKTNEYYFSSYGLGSADKFTRPWIVADVVQFLISGAVMNNFDAWRMAMRKWEEYETKFYTTDEQVAMRLFGVDLSKIPTIDITVTTPPGEAPTLYPIDEVVMNRNSIEMPELDHPLMNFPYESGPYHDRVFNEDYEEVIGQTDPVGKTYDRPSLADGKFNPFRRYYYIKSMVSRIRYGLSNSMNFRNNFLRRRFMLALTSIYFPNQYYVFEQTPDGKLRRYSIASEIMDADGAPPNVRIALDVFGDTGGSEDEYISVVLREKIRRLRNISTTITAFSKNGQMSSLFDVIYSYATSMSIIPNKNIISKEGFSKTVDLSQADESKSSVLLDVPDMDDFTGNDAGSGTYIKRIKNYRTEISNFTSLVTSGGRSATNAINFPLYLLEKIVTLNRMKLATDHTLDFVRKDFVIKEAIIGIEPGKKVNIYDMLINAIKMDADSIPGVDVTNDKEMSVEILMDALNVTSYVTPVDPSTAVGWDPDATGAAESLKEYRQEMRLVRIATYILQQIYVINNFIINCPEVYFFGFAESIVFPDKWPTWPQVALGSDSVQNMIKNFVPTIRTSLIEIYGLRVDRL